VVLSCIGTFSFHYLRTYDFDDRVSKFYEDRRRSTFPLTFYTQEPYKDHPLYWPNAERARVLDKIELLLQHERFLVDETNASRGLAQNFLFKHHPNSEWLPNIHYQKAFTVNQMAKIKYSKSDRTLEEDSDGDEGENSRNVNTPSLYFSNTFEVKLNHVPF